MAMMHVLTNPVLGLQPGNLGILLCRMVSDCVRVLSLAQVYTLIYVYVAPPTLVGAWSMALRLWRCIEYFTEALFTSVCICVCLLTHNSDDHQT